LIPVALVVYALMRAQHNASIKEVFGVIDKHERDCHLRAKEWVKTGWNGMIAEISRVRLF